MSHDGDFDLASSNLETEELWFPLYTVMDWLHKYLGGAEADPKGLGLAYSVTR